MHSTYCKGFLEHLRPDGRFHPSYFLHNAGEDSGGTRTGRLSARDPAFQTTPKHSKRAKKLRRAFVAPKGYTILGGDYSQGELKIAACLANELVMIQAYKEGMDLHSITSSSLKGISWEKMMWMKENDPDEFDLLRFTGKAANFGLIYGMQAAGFREYASVTYGVKMTEQEAEVSRERFFLRYPALLPWHEAYKEYAKKWKCVRSPLGRIRHLPLIDSKNWAAKSKAERQAINSPVQSTLSDFSLWAEALIDKEYGFDPTLSGGICSFGQVHDQLLFYVPEDDCDVWAGRLKAVMENLPFHEIGWEPQLKFTVDFEVGKSFDALKKLKV